MGLKSLFNRKNKKTTNPNENLSSSISISSSHQTPLASRSTSVNTRARIEEELEQVFKKFDVNGDGKISALELGSIMGSLGHPTNEEDLQKMIIEFDSDGDGCINLREFVELNTKDVGYDEELMGLRDAFEVYDIDKNGSISAEELFNVMKSLGEECTLAECVKMISGVDADGNGAISFDEFKVMMMKGSRHDGLEIKI